MLFSVPLRLVKPAPDRRMYPSAWSMPAILATVKLMLKIPTSTVQTLGR